MAQSSFKQRCFYDKQGNLTLGQRPNTAQITGLLSLLLAYIFSGNTRHTLLLISYGAWFTWAWLEVFQGANYFRRALGVAMFMVLLSVAVYSA